MNAYTVEVAVPVDMQVLITGKDAADEIVAWHSLTASGCVARLTESSRGSLLLAPEDGVLRLLLTGIACVH